MPEHIYTFVSRGFSVDALTNSLSAFSLLEAFSVSGLPKAVAELAVVTLWLRQPGEEGVPFEQRVSIVDPTDHEMAHSDSSFTFDAPRHRVVTLLTMVPFAQVGTYRFDVCLKQKGDSSWSPPVARYPIDVRLARPDDQVPLSKETPESAERATNAPSNSADIEDKTGLSD